MNYLWKDNRLTKSEESVREKVTIMNPALRQIKKPETVSQTMLTIKKRKRYRSAFTTSQVSILEKEFKSAPYVNNLRREQLATSLRLPERAIKIWFQNRRMKEKRESTTMEDDTLPTVGEITMDSRQKTPESFMITEEDKRNKANKQLIKSEDKMTGLSQVKTKNPTTASTMKSNVTIVQKSNENSTRLITYNRTSTHNEKRQKKIHKQPVGHVQPFSQVSVIQPQKTASVVQETKPQESLAYHHYVRAFGADPQLTAQFPQQPFTGLIPVLPPDAPSLLYSGLQPPPFQMELGLTRKCCCDCHRPEMMAAISAPNLQVPPFFYTHYLPQFVTPSTSTGQF